MSVSYRDAAVVLWGPAGDYVHESYARQRHLLPELPEQVPLVIGIPAYGKCLGLTRGAWSPGPRITLASNLFAQGGGMVDDVLLHEMLHAWLTISGLSSAHAGRPWYDAVRRLSPLVLGRDLDVRRGGDRRSTRVANPNAGQDGQPATLVRKVTVQDAIPHGAVACWPNAFRPAEHDWGEPIDCPSY